MAIGRSWAAVIGKLAIVVLVAGCAAKSDQQKQQQLESMSAKEIYNLAEHTLEVEKNPKAAAHDFSEIQRLYPYSSWAKRATIMEAYADQQARKYGESRAAAERYLEFYPADKDAAYAQYLVALSYYDQIDSVGRDQAVTLKALKALRKVIENYPNSGYARSAAMKFDLAFNRMAGKQMEVGRYYLKRGEYAAAINRFRTVVETYQTTTYTPEALERLVEAYTALGLNEQAQTAGAILGYNFQSSPFYQSAYRLLTAKGLKPRVAGHSWLTEIYRQMILGKWL